MQAELGKKDAQIIDLQENIKLQQTETSKAKEELHGALVNLEKLKVGLKQQINAMTTAVIGKIFPHFAM